MSKGDLFADLMQGLHESKEHDLGKRTLRTTQVNLKELSIEAAEIVSIRESLGLSQAVFAAYLHAKKRTYQKWEQGAATPNEQAVTLLRLVERSPAVLKDIASL